MNDIEMLIKRMSFIEEGYLSNGHMRVGNFNDIDKAIELLKERQADKDRIKELEAINAMQEYRINEMDIPKSLVKEAIKELKDDIQFSANPLSIENSKFGIKVLQELLGEKQDLQINKEE